MFILRPRQDLLTLTGASDRRFAMSTASLSDQPVGSASGGRCSPSVTLDGAVVHGDSPAASRSRRSVPGTRRCLGGPVPSAPSLHPSGVTESSPPGVAFVAHRLLNQNSKTTPARAARTRRSSRCCAHAAGASSKRLERWRCDEPRGQELPFEPKAIPAPQIWIQRDNESVECGIYIGGGLGFELIRETERVR